MSGKYLIDTNVAIAALNGTLDLAAHRTAGAEFYLNATVVGELCFGAENSERVEQNLAASEHGLVLVTRDEHFDQVEGLLVERW